MSEQPSPEVRVVIWRDEGGQRNVSLGFVAHEDVLEVVLASTWRIDGHREVFTHIEKQHIEGKTCAS